MEILGYILFLLAFSSWLLWVIGSIIAAVRRKSSDSEINSSGFSDFYFREKFWTCSECFQEFRLDDGHTPLCCPYCGKHFSQKALLPDEEQNKVIITCPHCSQKFEMLDGDDADYCPYCGLALNQEN